MKQTIRKRWVKTTVALVFAFGGAFFLTETILYPGAPLVREDFLVKTDILLARAKDKISRNLLNKNDNLVDKPGEEMPPPYFFSPVPGFSKPKTPDEKQILSPANPVPTTGLVYPTRDAYPTYNPVRKITPIPPPVDNRPYPTQKPIFNPPTEYPTQPPGAAPSSLASELLSLINQERAKEGAGKIVFNDSLNTAAQNHANTTPGCGHYGPDGSTPFDRVIQAGYPSLWVGENIACGVVSPKRAFDLWMNSPPHHANMVEKKWKSAGIGIARGYWVFVGGPI